MTTKRRAPEKRVQGDVKRALWTLGFHVSDLSQPRASMQTPGLPDLYVLHRRWKLACWIEVKAPGGKLSGAQQVWHDEAAACGELVMVVRSVEELVAGLKDLGVPIN